MARSVELHRQAHAAFNARDWSTMRGLLSEGITYEDHPRGLTITSSEEFVGWLQSWVKGFSDASPSEPRYIDGGDYSIALFQARGTNDGDFGPVSGTGNRMDAPFCEVLHVGPDGKIDRGELYYDNVTIMVQMGAMAPPEG